MNILVIADTIFPDEEGGAGRMAWEQSRRLCMLGHNVTILTRKKPVLPREQVMDNVRIYRYEFNPVRPAFSLFNCRKAASILIEKNKFNIAVIHSPFSGLGVILSKGMKNIPCVYNFHSPWPEEYEIRYRHRAAKNIFYRPVYHVAIGIRKIIEGRVISASRKIIVLSSFMRGKLLDYHGFVTADIEILSGAVDTGRFRPAENRDAVRRELGLPVDAQILLTVRNLLPRMGLDNLILAIKEVAARCGNFLLLIAGRGFLENELKSMVKESKLEHCVNFPGFISEDRLPLYYSSADLFILPTKYLEGFGLVTAEALSSGTPVLATPIGATPEILGGISPDLLFKDTSPGSMAGLIVRYLQDPDIYRDLRLKCREFAVKNYSWDSYIKKIEAIYNGICKV